MKPRIEEIVCWHIRGYDGTTEICNQTVPVGQMSQKKLEELLRALAGRGLSSCELANAYANRNTKRYNGFLQVRTENYDVKRRTNYYCGQNPHYSATTVTFDKTTLGAASEVPKSF